MALQALVFDVDGTLADTERDGHRPAFNAAFAHAGLPWHWDVAVYGGLLGVTGGKERIRHYCERHDPGFLARPDADESIAALPKGISRHVVRFVRVAGTVYALKELPQDVAEREYRLLRELGKREVPVVRARGVVIERTSPDGEELDSALVTKHLRYSLPYRALFSRRLDPELADKLLDALAQLLVRLHLVGFAWKDCSLSNTLFRRDAGALAAYLSTSRRETVPGHRDWNDEPLSCITPR